MPAEMSSESFVDQIKAIIAERGANYAHPQDNHGLTASLFDMWYATRLENMPRSGFTPEDVCVFNIMQKLSRLANGTHDDSYIDIVGYAENVSMLALEQRNRRE